MEQWHYDGGKYGKCSEHLHGDGHKQWLYEHGTINGDDNDHDGVDSRSNDLVYWRQHNIDGLRRRYLCVEQWSYDGGKYGKFSEHLYGNSDKQWLYKHSPIDCNPNNGNSHDQRSDDLV